MFYLFLKVFLCITCILKVFSKSQICFVEKLLQKHFHEYITSKVSRTLVAKIRKQIFISSKILHRKFYDSLISVLWETTSHETCPVHLRHFASTSQELREKLSREMSRFSVFKGVHSGSFSKVYFCLLRTSLNLKHHFHANLNQNSLDFISKSSLRYVLTTFIL